MVRIIDGEIVPDDDPRLRGGPARRPGGAAGAVAGGSGSSAPAPQSHNRRSVFDWNAPPLRVVPDADGTSLGGLPGLMVFGARVPAQHLLMLAGLLLIFGWKGALAGGLLWFWFQHQQLAAGRGGGGQPSAGGNQQARLAAAQDYFQSMFGNQAPLGRGGVAGRPAGSAAPSNAGERPAAASDPWAARGRPRRLADDTQ
ncbi:hypothetical protein ABPG75_013403 [Micractinium tetrahymenae]